MDNQDLMSRLGRLERQNLWLKRVGALALTLIAAGMLATQWVPARTLVEAGGFALGDGSGRTVALLSSSADGGPFLILYDEAGAPRGTLSLSLAGPSCLSFRDRHGHVVWALRCQREDVPPASSPPTTPPRPASHPDRWRSLLIGSS